METESQYRNKNRGYQKLPVWQDALEFYAQCSRMFRAFPYKLKRVASLQIASADSLRRNIAEGYCRRSIHEYLNFLNFALGWPGESASGLHAYWKADPLSKNKYASIDAPGFELENGLLRLVESLERKKLSGDWIECLIVEDSNVTFGS